MSPWPPCPGNLLWEAWSDFWILKKRIPYEQFRKLWNLYLASDQWQNRRAGCFRRAKGLCERCGQAPAQEANHLHYARRFREPLVDLQALCSPCHRFVSQKGPDPIIDTKRQFVQYADLVSRLDGTIKDLRTIGLSIQQREEHLQRRLERTERQRGDGRVFRRGSIWWISVSRNGQEHRESSRSVYEYDAVQLLRKRCLERELARIG